MGSHLPVHLSSPVPRPAAIFLPRVKIAVYTVFISAEQKGFPPKRGSPSVADQILNSYRQPAASNNFLNHFFVLPPAYLIFAGKSITLTSEQAGRLSVFLQNSNDENKTWTS